MANPAIHGLVLEAIPSRVDRPDESSRVASVHFGERT